MGTVMNQAWMVEVMFTVPLNVLNTCLKHCKFSNPDNCATWWCESIIFQTLTLTEFIIWNTIDLYICTNIKIRTLEFEARFRSDPSVFQPFPTQLAFQPSLHRLKLN